MPSCISQQGFENSGVTLIQMGRLEEALEVYQHMVSTFAKAENVITKAKHMYASVLRALGAAAFNENRCVCVYVSLT